MTYKIETIGTSIFGNNKCKTIKVSSNDKSSITLIAISSLIVKIEQKNGKCCVYGINDEFDTPRLIKSYNKSFDINRIDKRFNQQLTQYKEYIIEVVSY